MRGIACGLRIAIAVSLLLSGCVTASVQTLSNPTFGPGWQLFGTIELGSVIALPNSWRAFDLDRDVDAAVAACWPANLRTAETSHLTELHSRGVRLFACNPALDGKHAPEIAYAFRGAVPSGDLDSYVQTLQQAPGRAVIDRKHVAANAGDMVFQTIRESTGTGAATTQMHFLLVKFNALHVLLIEMPTGSEDVDVATRVGTSYTPLR